MELNEMLFADMPKPARAGPGVTRPLTKARN